MIYRKVSLVNTFYVKRQQFVKEYNIDLLLGNFSINALDAKHQDRLSISSVGYTQIIHEPTHLGWGLLDQFYAKENFLSGKNVYSVVVNVYFSDHDTVQVTFYAG